MARLERILDRADQLGMVAILGYRLCEQDQVVRRYGFVRRVRTMAW